MVAGESPRTLPAQCVPSLLEGLMVNQSRSEALLISMYLISACSSCKACNKQQALRVASQHAVDGRPAGAHTRREAQQLQQLRLPAARAQLEACHGRRTSFSRFCHSSLSRGPALTVSSGIFCTVARVVGSHDASPMAAATTAPAAGRGW